jgi:hypothetical protein
MKRTLLYALICLLIIFLIVVIFPKRKITNYPSNGTDIVAFGDSLVRGVGSSGGGGGTMTQQLPASKTCAITFEGVVRPVAHAIDIPRTTVNSIVKSPIVIGCVLMYCAVLF